MTQQEIITMIEDYENGMTMNDIIKKYHHKYQTIKKYFKQNNVHIRDKSEAGHQTQKYQVSKEIEQKIVENYKNGMGQVAAGAEFNVGSYKVKQILKKYNIYKRNKHESIQLRNIVMRKYHFNENYFKNMSSNVAYILGFLAADGSVGMSTNELKITLAEKDTELLEKIKQELEFDGPIHHATTSKGYDIASLEIHSAIYKKDLAIYNIIPQKTFTFSIPDTLEKKYWIDFIRGYWDGDGTICTAGKNVIRSSLCSARKETLYQILTYLEEEYDIPKVKIQIKQGVNPTYYFQYSVNSTKKLYHALYYNNDVLCMKRKHEKFIELCTDNIIHETAHPK